MGSRENRKEPLGPVTTSCVNPVATFKTLTIASGIPAALESRTVPPRLAVVNCPWAGCGQIRTASARIAKTALLFNRCLQMTRNISASLLISEQGDGRSRLNSGVAQHYFFRLGFMCANDTTILWGVKGFVRLAVSNTKRHAR